MRPPAPTPEGYTPRRPEQTDLHRVVSAWWPTFEERAEDAGGLPGFVVKTFEHYLRCGILAHGFARVSCPTCGDDLLVAWSCRRRGLCPSCSGRRMADTAAHLVDRVLPDVPVRQWVLTLPFALRTRVAFDHRLADTVRNLFLETVRRAYQDHARRAGVLGTTATGSVTVTQRFGSALNLNPHIHSLLLDGVYHRPNPDGPLVFAPHPRPTDALVDDVLAAFVDKLAALWRRRGDDDAAAEEPPEAEPSAMSQLTLTALGLKGEPPRRSKTESPRRPWPSPRSPRGRKRPRPYKPLCAELAGFTLHAATAVQAGKRGDLEVLCRYVLRPGVTQDRVRWREDDTVEWRLSRPWSDGTTSLVFQPLDFLARLAALIPKPYVHEIAYHGVLAPAARWRAEVVARAPKAGGVRRPRRPCEDGDEPDAGVRPRRLDWAALLWRSFTTDVLTCATCGGRRKVLALVQDPTSIKAILTHLGLACPTAPPVRPRGPPQGRLDLSPTT